jgi:hypothetical protein
VIPPGRAAGETFGILPRPVLGEVTDGQLGHHHDADRCAGLGLNEPQLAADALERPANVKLPRVQVDIGPSQAEQLAPPQSGCQRQDVEGFEPFALDDLQEMPA